MRYAVLSDIHSNIEALGSVLLRISELKADRIVCLGDIVGYNADPNACVSIIKDLEITTVAGNHDKEAVSTMPPHNMSPAAEESILWTREELTEENKEFLTTLPEELEIDGIFIALHSPKDTENRYIRSKYAAEAVFELMDSAKTKRLAFIGHTHARSIFKKTGEEIIEEKTIGTIKLEEKADYLINPGSVGQPRAGNPNASFLIYDSTANLIEFQHVAYDIEATTRKIRAADLPEINAKRLTLGR